MKPVQVRLPIDAYQALAAFAHVHKLTLGGAAAALVTDVIMGRAFGLPPAPERDVSGFVYVIRVGELCKIGKAVDVQARIRSLHLAIEPVIIATKHSTAPFELERLLHTEFKHLRERREWFRLGPSDIDRARSMLADDKVR